MTTIAKVTESKNAHWYTVLGEPTHTVIAKGNGLPRPTTLADARKMNLLPSVTTIIDGVLRKPALEAWKIEQGVLACLTSPRLDGEAIDAFVERVLHTERVQEQESQIARDRGIEIHSALEGYYQGHGIPEEMKPWVKPVLGMLVTYGELVATEKILVGPGYAGKTDLILEAPDCWWLFDFKSTKKLPNKGPWPEHKLQLCAYARAYFGMTLDDKPIRTANAYVSTVDMGEFIICEHEEPWRDTYNEGFEPVLRFWRWANNYQP